MMGSGYFIMMALFVYLIEIIVLSIFFFFSKKIKTLIQFVFWGGFLPQIPFILLIIYSIFLACQLSMGLERKSLSNTIEELLLYETLANWGGMFYGLVHYFIFVKR